MAKKTITVNGISVKVNPAALTDYSITELLIKISAPLPEEGTELFQKASLERASIATQLVDLVLGDEKEKVIKAIRKKHKGYAPTEEVIKYVSEVVSKAAEENTTLKK